MTIEEYRQHCINQGSPQAGNAIYNYYQALKKEGLLWLYQKR